MGERATTLQKELYPGMALKPWENPEDRDEYDVATARYHAETSIKDRMQGIFKAGDEPTKRDYAIEELKRYEEAVEKIRWVFMQIRKSNLLARLLYDGQALRTMPCPEHKGHWSGCKWPKDPKDLCPCMDGCNVTGWLPNEARGAGLADADAVTAHRRCV